DANLNSVNPYHFNTISAYDAWDVTQGDTNVVIGITDTSFDVDHEDMEGNIKYNYDDPVGNGDDDNDNYIDNYAGWDMVDDDNDLFINNEIHGTAVAAIASATADNGIGYAGIGFKCKFLPVKVANNLQVVTKGYEGIQYCVEQGCSVVNCSWGNTTFNQAAQDIITWAAINNDVVIVAAAGNDDATPMFYPASYNYALSVTGVNANDIFDDGVNPPFTRNDSVDVSAPGYDVYTTATFGGNPLYAPPQGGTSMASPVVAGLAGLVRSQFPCLTALEVIEQIKATADPIDAITENVPYAGLLGTGRVNAHTAVLGTLCDPIGMSVSESTSGGLNIYPNPSVDEVTIEIDHQAQWLKIYDANGRLTVQKRLVNKRITVSGLDAGFYVANVLSDNGILTQKFAITGN
ncbi:MAG: S8 family peptidase, partial [Flavobacteriales bacterium]|nr:S8 family peptidase [Flavobacteriales bacterium]